MSHLVRTLHQQLLPALVAALISGLTLSAQTSIPGRWTVMALGCAIFTLGFFSFKGRSTASLLTACAVFFLLGCRLGTVSGNGPMPSHHIYHLVQQPEDLVAVGRLVAMPTFNGKTSQVLIELESVQRHTDPRQRPACGKVLIRLYDLWPEYYRPGDRLALRVSLQRPDSSRVPGVFDYPRELARRGIWMTGKLRTPALAHPVTGSGNPLQKLRFLPERWRTAAGLFLDKHTSPEASPLYRAILLGDRSRIDDTALEAFRASGTLHILAISGLHLTIVAGLLYTIFSWLLRRSEYLILHTNVKKLAGILAMPPVILYSLLAGGNIPVVRACIMSCVLLLAFCGNRARSLPHLIAFGALLILVHSPQALFTASFQLSFTALSAILLTVPVIQRLPTGPSSHSVPGNRPLTLSLAHWLLAAILVSTSAVLATAPITIHHFHRLPVLAPLTNLVMEPLICLWSLPCGVVALFAMKPCPDLAELLLKLGSIGLTLARDLGAQVREITWASLWAPRPPPYLVIVYYGLFLWVSHCWRKNMTTRRRVLATSLLSSCLLLLVSPIARYHRGHVPPTAYLLEVGQGSGGLVRLDNGNYVLIDGGGSAYGTTDVGERIIAPFLWAQGVATIETIILTHPDADHTNGVRFLVEHFSPTTLYTSTTHQSSRGYRLMLETAHSKGVQVVVPQPGILIKTSRTSVTCLANTRSEPHSARNDGLVLQVEMDGIRMLFPGDIEKKSEDLLVANGINLDSDILLAPHHGSATSGSPRFLAAVSPEAIIVSAGRSRPTTYPSPTLRSYCRLHRLPLFITAEDGSIRLSTTSQGPELQVWAAPNNNPLRRHAANWQSRERIQ